MQAIKQISLDMICKEDFCVVKSGYHAYNSHSKAVELVESEATNWWNLKQRIGGI